MIKFTITQKFTETDFESMNSTYEDRPKLELEIYEVKSNNTIVYIRLIYILHEYTGQTGSMVIKQ